MKHPIYLALTTAACVWMLTAHTRGLNPLFSLFLARTGQSGSGLNHK